MAKKEFCPVGTKIQTLIFDKNVFTKAKATAWAKKHQFNYSVDEKENTYRMRQIEPSEFDKDTFRTIDLTKGVQAVIACPVKLKKGGKLGNTSSGKIIYDIKPENETVGVLHADFLKAHKEFTKQDHIDAIETYQKLIDKNNDLWEKAYKSVTPDEYNDPKNTKGNKAYALSRKYSNLVNHYIKLQHWHNKLAYPERFAEGGEIEITPALNSKVIKKAEKIYAENNGQTKEDFDKAYDKAIVEFGFEPIQYKEVMAQIGCEYDESDDEFEQGGEVMNELMKNEQEYKKFINKYIEFADTWDGEYGFMKRLIGSKAKNGDKSNGVFRVGYPRNEIHFHYIDGDGNEYESFEEPSIRIDMSGNNRHKNIKQNFAKGGNVDNRIPIYGVFGSYIQDKQAFAPFLKNQPKWTSSLTEATKIYESITLKDFQQDKLKERKNDAIGDVSFDGFLLIELNYCVIDENYFNKSNKDYHSILEHVDYDIELEKERGISLTGKKLSKEEMEDNLYAKGGGVVAKYSPRFASSPLLRYANFEDDSHVNLLRLKDWHGQGKSYKDESKYVVKVGSPDNAEQNYFKFKTLPEAEHRFNELVEERLKIVKLRNQGVVENNFAEGGEISVTEYTDAIETLQELADISEGEEKQSFLDAIEALKEQLNIQRKPSREEQIEQLIQDLSEDFKPYVAKIEKSLATTQNHYGNYASIISGNSRNKAEAYLIGKALKRAGANSRGVDSALQVLYGYKQGGSLPSTAKVIVISSKNPLNFQFQKMGVTENEQVYNQSEPHVYKTNIGYIVTFSANYYAQVDKHVIKDNLSFVKYRFPEITDFIWIGVPAPKFEDGGEVENQNDPYENLSDYLNYQPKKSLILKDYPQVYDILSEEYNNEILLELEGEVSNENFDKILAEKIDNAETTVLVSLLIDELIEEFTEPVVPKQLKESGEEITVGDIVSTKTFTKGKVDQIDTLEQDVEFDGKKAKKGEKLYKIIDMSFPQSRNIRGGWYTAAEIWKGFAKGGQMDENDLIPALESANKVNRYTNMTSEHVWNSWTVNQRRHFLYDHYQRNNQNLDTYQNLFGSVEKPFDELQYDIQVLIYNHIQDGSYAKGGTMEKKKGRSGLIVTGLTPDDSEKLKKFAEESDYYAEHNIIENYFFFPEEESLLDNLEGYLNNEFNNLGINAKFEACDDMPDMCECGCKLELGGTTKFSYGGKFNRGERPSPRYSATLFNEGHEQEGQDGNTYVVVSDKRGVKRWQKVKYATGGELHGGQYATLKTPYRGYRNIQLIEFYPPKWLVRIVDSGLEISVYADEFEVDRYESGGSLAECSLKEGIANKTSAFMGYAYNEISDFLKTYDIEINDDWTFVYKNKKFIIAPLIDIVDNDLKEAIFFIYSEKGTEVGEISYIQAKENRRFQANSRFFKWENEQFAKGGKINYFGEEPIDKSSPEKKLKDSIDHFNKHGIAVFWGKAGRMLSFAFEKYCKKNNKEFYMTSQTGNDMTYYNIDHPEIKDTKYGRKYLNEHGFAFEFGGLLNNLTEKDFEQKRAIMLSENAKIVLEKLKYPKYYRYTFYILEDGKWESVSSYGSTNVYDVIYDADVSEKYMKEYEGSPELEGSRPEDHWTYHKRGGEVGTWHAGAGYVAGIPQITYKKRDYHVNVDLRNLEVDVNIDRNDSVDQYKLSDTDVDWGQEHWGYMIYPKSIDELYAVLDALNINYSKKQLNSVLTFKPKVEQHAKGGNIALENRLSMLMRELRGMNDVINNNPDVSKKYRDDAQRKQAEIEDIVVELKKQNPEFDITKFEQGGTMTNDDALKMISHWVYFTFNYPPNFLDAFGEKGTHNRDHLEEKFNQAYSNVGSYAVMNDFYSKLDGNNTHRLLQWAVRNYEPFEVNDVMYYQVVNKYIAFTYNYHHDFLNIFHDDHLKIKFSNLYDTYGAKAVMGVFYAELGEANREKLVNYILNVYKYKKGGNIENTLYMVKFYLSETDKFETQKECMQVFDDSQAIFTDFPLAIVSEIIPVAEKDIVCFYDDQQSKAFPYRIFKYTGSDNERCKELLIEGSYYHGNFADDNKYVIIYTHPLGYMSFDAQYFSAIPEGYKMDDLSDDVSPFASTMFFARGGNVSRSVEEYYKRKAEKSMKLKNKDN